MTIGSGCLSLGPDSSLSLDGDSVMSATAVSRARLPVIRSRLRRASPGEQFFVLWTVPVDRYGVRYEHLWVRAIVWDEQGVMGTLVSSPRGAAGLRTGQTVAVPQDRIADYAVTREGEVVEGAVFRNAGEKQEDGERKR